MVGIKLVTIAAAFTVTTAVQSLAAQQVPDMASPVSGPIAPDVTTVISLPNTPSPMRALFDESVRPRPAPLVGVPAESRQILRAFYAEQGDRPVWTATAWQNIIEAAQDYYLDGLNVAAYRLNAVDITAMSDDTDPQRRALIDLEASVKLLRLFKDVRLGVVPHTYSDPESAFPNKSVDFAALLNGAAKSNDTKHAFEQALPSLPEYKALRQVLSALKKRRAAGGYTFVTGSKALTVGSIGSRVQQLHARLIEGGDLSDDVGTTFTQQTADAVKSAQRRHRLRETGIADSALLTALNVPIDQRINTVLVNLERTRRLPEAYAEKLISVNVPEFMLEMYQNGTLQGEMPVIAGRTERPSPSLYSELNAVDFHPYWYVPSKLAVEDLIPLYLRNPRAFRNLGIRVYLGENEINPSQVNWHEYSRDNFPYRLRQDPGDDNSLGDIKFTFNNKFAVFLHDTPHRELFKKHARALSSGCIRVYDPQQLATFVLQGKRDAEAVQQLLANDKRVVVSPASDVSIRISYLTARVDNSGALRFSPDLYQYDAAMQQALAQSGVVMIDKPAFVPPPPERN